MVDACCLTQNIDFPKYVRGDTLNLFLAPMESSAISQVHGSCFISDHKIVSCLVDFPPVANHQDKVVT